MTVHNRRKKFRLQHQSTMNGYVRVKEQLHTAAACNANSALQNSIEDWEYKINPGKSAHNDHSTIQD